MIANKDIVDFGSGYGGFLYLAKDVAKSVAGVEIESSVKDVYEERGITLYERISDVQSVDIITSFHCIEHLPNPIETLREFKAKLHTGGKILIEVPNANDALLTLYKSEAFAHFTYWSAHLYLFTPFTLTHLARRAGLKVEFIKCVQRYPLSNHLYWLAHKKPAGHKVWGNFIDNEALNRAYEDTLAGLGVSDTLLAIFS
ncbi:class I SAM-dependent methyltransferase [Helicobacter jaachi]|uniref:Class I SAM-dependent methyltransferase n=2 Tax=Helicobacter jaachi TaxID=1677920 RepID=A0A4U8TBN1_9HELI|nr:class I SAM-dependent methyltransferase [Helicobacter jaachi]